MKTIKKEIKLELTEESVSINRDSMFCDSRVQEFKFISHELVDRNRLSHFIEIDVPDSLKEFRSYFGLSKTELLDWLNENYKGAPACSGHGNVEDCS